VTDQTDQFIQEVLPEATQAARVLNIPTSAVLAQWINETGSGTSEAWLQGHNPAGISILEPAMERLGAHIPEGWGELLAFPDVGHGLLAYLVRWNEPVYASTRERWAQNRDPIAVAEAIQDSPWAAGHYDHHGLVDLIDQHNLRQYDEAPTPVSHPPAPGNQPPGGAPEPPCSALPPGPPPDGLPLLKVGSTGGAVAGLQAKMAEAGFPPTNSHKADGSWDGVFGPGTAEAVVHFQAAHGLHPDGIVGRQVYCALGVR
jgi:hypothetical protein